MKDISDPFGAFTMMCDALWGWHSDKLCWLYWAPSGSDSQGEPRGAEWRIADNPDLAIETYSNPSEFKNPQS